MYVSGESEMKLNSPLPFVWAVAVCVGETTVTAAAAMPAPVAWSTTRPRKPPVVPAAPGAAIPPISAKIRAMPEKRTNNSGLPRDVPPLL